jgi:6-phosphogluconate dehydrogenase
LINQCAAHIKMKMAIIAHVSLDGLCIIRSKLLQNITSILCLANENLILDLHDLKSKEEYENTHHGHFKSIGHDFAKLITKEFVSRTKNNVINIYLAFK